MFGKEDQLDARDKNVSCNGFLFRGSMMRLIE